MAGDESNTPLKICTRCHLEFPATAEFFHRNGKNGWHSECKACARAWRELHKDTINAKGRQHRAGNLEQYLKDEAEYRDTHREAVRARGRKYQRAHAEETKPYSLAYYYAHREIINARIIAWAKAHPEEHRLNVQRFRRNNPQSVARTQRLYRQKYPEKIRLKNENRRTKQLSLPTDYPLIIWMQAKAYWHYACAVCGNEEGFFWTLAIDHWIPVASAECPGTIPTNIVPLCHGTGGCNNAKRDQDPQVWLIKKLGKRAAQKKLREIWEFFTFMDTLWKSEGE